MIYVTGYQDTYGYDVITGAIIGNELKAKKHAVLNAPNPNRHEDPFVIFIMEFDNLGRKVYSHTYWTNEQTWKWSKVSYVTKVVGENKER